MATDVAPIMAAKQRAIAVSEFFLKNRHLLGFDSPARALLSAVKEAVDNALDACEEAGHLPDIQIEVRERPNGVFAIAVEDNGPGIVEEQVTRVFGKLLYGSKFHKLAQSRGTQGIGISAAGMYAQLTTGKPLRVTTRTCGRPAHEFVLSIDTSKNRPDLHRKARVEWSRPHGTRVELELEGRYQSGAHSVESYLNQTAIANPHASLRLLAPDGEARSWERSTDRLPPAAAAIEPHPHGVELGQLIAMLRDTEHKTLSRFLREEFSAVGAKTAQAIIARAGAGLSERSRPARIAHGQAASLHRAIAHTKIRGPSAACLVPIGTERLLAGLRKEVRAGVYFAVTRPPAVYRGNPFVVEAAVAFGQPGGFELDASGRIVRVAREARDPTHVPAADEPAALIRYANRTPLLFQQSACAIAKAVTDTNWRGYGVDQPRGALPIGPLVVLVHVASVWVPFTSESKEAIARYPEIVHEIELALQHCGRKLRAHLSRGRRLRQELERRERIERYLPHLGASLQAILGLSDGDRDATVQRLESLLEARRAARYAP